MLISNSMLILTEATLFFANMLTNTSSDDKVALANLRVENWANVVDTSPAQPLSIIASPRTSTSAPLPSPSTLTTSASYVGSYLTPDVTVRSTY